MRLPFEVLCLTGAFDGGFRGSDGDWFVSALLFSYFCFPIVNTLISDMSKRRITFLLIVLYFLCGVAPFVQLFNGFGFVYPSPFFRMLQFSIGILLAACIVENQKRQKYSVMAASIIATASYSILIILITILSHRGIADYMYYVFLSIPCFFVMICSMYYIKEPLCHNGLLNEIINFFSVNSFPFYIAQKFCFSAGDAIISMFSPINCSNAVRLLLYLLVCIIMTVLFKYIDLHIRKLIKGKKNIYRTLVETDTEK